MLPDTPSTGSAHDTEAGSIDGNDIADPSNVQVTVVREKNRIAQVPSLLALTRHSSAADDLQLQAVRIKLAVDILDPICCSE